MKKPDLLILIAIWDFIVAAGSLLFAILIAAFGFPITGNMEKGPAVLGAVAGLSILVLVLAVVIVVSFAGGIGLLRGKEWGRVLSMANAAISLFSVPIGTAVGILSIIYLTRPDVKEHFKPPATAI
jgi:hypothetical protein